MHIQDDIDDILEFNEKAIFDIENETSVVEPQSRFDNDKKWKAEKTTLPQQEV